MAFVLILIMSNLVTVYTLIEQLLVLPHVINEAVYDVSLDDPSDNLSDKLTSDVSDTSMSDQGSGDYNNSSFEKQGTFLKIEGVEFPIRSNFLTPRAAESDWGGSFSSWMDLEQILDHKIIGSTDLILTSDKIEFTHAVAGSDGVILTKTETGYKISISVKLSGSVLAEQNAAIVKAMVVTISSEPTKVYNAIFASFTTGETHGITQKKYKKIGDCKIKLKIMDGVVSYLITKAM